MIVKSSVDMQKLERSIKKYAKEFGESSAQAVTRWSVFTARELAKYSQPFGKKNAYIKPMWKDALNCTIPIKGRVPQGGSALKTPEEIIKWIDSNRIKKGKRVSVLPITKRKRCSMDNLKKAITIKAKNAGMAKGGWIGAGKKIAQNQKGTNRVTIGSNYIGYAHKFSHLGYAKPPSNGFEPIGTIADQARHSASNYVLRSAHIKRAITDGRKKCLKFYQIVVNKLNKK